ncbi:hypothetical protein [Streptomyces sp. DSM 40750]|uniref:hypothetical protein n=1 Tax=Streptomyces sp. DSM 40750 TaxID=2801030 RepID=UPI00214B0F30|nr:hypothetical protein [Streptomyces sp. DSM 40750]UUU24632.1 hypothetical protein JIX55_32700 [Streptomyces sp. DSM 40750]
MSCLGVLVGLLVVLVPAGSSVAVADSCADDRFTERLKCWAERIPDGPVVITLQGALKYEEVGEEQRQAIERLRDDTHPFVVQVPKDTRTGEGGTALLLLADGLLVDRGATIDRLRPKTRADLEALGLCEENLLCGEVGPKTGSHTLPGKQLLDKGFAADPSTNTFAVEPVENDVVPAPSTSSGKPDDKADKDREGQDGDGKDQGGQDQDGTDRAADRSGSTWTALWMGLLLALLLLAFVIVIRRSRGPVAVGHRAAVSPGRALGGPARAAPAHAAAHGGGTGGDERTARLRVAPAPRHGRHVGARPTHARTAVVRTELHPQGYVELDRVLRRAVWAEPGRPPPAPGGLVDVADARERDADVLYAFPPTAARHAKGTPR